MRDTRPNNLIRRICRVVTREGDTAPDGALLDRFARTRDQEAFEMLVWRYAGLVLGVCRRVARDAEVAEDAFQATFLVLARRAGTVQKHASLGSWLHKVAYRAALAARKSSARRAHRTRPLETDPIGRESDPADAAADRETDGLLDAAIAGLPDKLRAAFVLCHLDGLTAAEAARQIGCPVGTVESRLSRARSAVRSRLSPAFATLAVATAVGFPSSRLVAAIVPMAVRLASGTALKVCCSARMVTLVNGVERMFWSPIRSALAAVTVLAGCLAVGVALTTAAPQAPPAAPPKAEAAPEIEVLRGRLGLSPQVGMVGQIQFSPSGKRLAVLSTKGDLVVYDTTADRRITPPTMAPIAGDRVAPIAGNMVFSSDDRKLFFLGARNNTDLYAYEFGQGIQRRTIVSDAHKGMGAVAALSPDGKTLATSGYYGDVALWDTESFKLTKRYGPAGNLVPEIGPAARHIRFNPAGTEVRTLHSDSCFRTWDLKTGKVQTNKIEPRILPFPSPSGKLKAEHVQGVLKVIDTTTGKTTLEKTIHEDNMMPAGPGPSQLQEHGFVMFSPDEKFVLVDDSRTRSEKYPDHVQTFRLFELRTGKEVWKVVTPYALGRNSVLKDGAKTLKFTAFAFSPDGKTIAVGCVYSIVKLKDAADPRVNRLPTGVSVIFLDAESGIETDPPLLNEKDPLEADWTW